MATTISLNGNMQITDGVIGTVSLQKPFVNLNMTGTTFLSATLVVPTSSTPITLPVEPINFLYIKNTGTTAVQVTWTPQSGVSATVILLEPSSAIILVEITAGAGIAALSVSSVASSSSIEYIIGG